MKLTFKYYWPAILWTLFILLMCSIKMGGISGSPMFFPGFDKLVHCGFYFVWVIVYANGFIRQRGLSALTFLAEVLITAVAIVYGGLIELLQAYVFTWRNGDWADLFADSVGACMATFSLLLIIAAIKYVKE
ncbi:MAG: VanZ family protein [Mucilaginibacter sp.]